MKRAFVLISVCLSVITSFASDQGVFPIPDQFYGEILSKPDRKPLFKYSRIVTRGDLVEVKRQYEALDGKPVAIETVWYQGEKAVKMKLEQLQTKEVGTWEVKGNELVFSFTKDGKEKKDTEKLEENFVSQDEIAPFMQKNWNQLVKGETIDIRLPVIFRTETVGFKFFKDSETDQIMIVTMKPSSFVIAALVKPLKFHFKKDDHRLLEVDGRVVPKLQDGNSWKDLDAFFVMKY